MNTNIIQLDDIRQYYMSLEDDQKTLLYSKFGSAEKSSSEQRGLFQQFKKILDEINGIESNNVIRKARLSEQLAEMNQKAQQFEERTIAIKALEKTINVLQEKAEAVDVILAKETALNEEKNNFTAIINQGAKSKENIVELESTIIEIRAVFDSEDYNSETLYALFKKVATVAVISSLDIEALAGCIEGRIIVDGISPRLDSTKAELATIITHIRELQTQATNAADSLLAELKKLIECTTSTENYKTE
jgi:hypothetical protein